MLSRRTFLNTGTAALATRLFAAPAGARKPNPELANSARSSLAEAKKLKATYCDIRIIRYRQQFLSIRLNPERGTGKTLEVPGVGDGGSFGFGVRVIVDGAWGFAASPLVTARRNRAHHRAKRCRSPRPMPSLQEQARRTGARPGLRRPLADSARAGSVRRPDPGEAGVDPQPPPPRPRNRSRSSPPAARWPSARRTSTSPPRRAPAFSS